MIHTTSAAIKQVFFIIKRKNIKKHTHRKLIFFPSNLIFLTSKILKKINTLLGGVNSQCFDVFQLLILTLREHVPTVNVGIPHCGGVDKHQR